MHGSVIKPNQELQIVVLISADQEWKAVKQHLKPANLVPSPYGEWFHAPNFGDNLPASVLFFQGGWGKTRAAGSTQYAIDHFQPDILINLGTCGGFAGSVEVGTIILVEKTVMYDIYEQMLDPDQAIAAYSTRLDLSFLKQPYPCAVVETVLVSADRDLFSDQIGELKTKYQAIAGDWESASIAHIAHLNHKPCLILRGVSDTVSPTGGEAYQNIELFASRTEPIMQQLIQELPAWIQNFDMNRLKKLQNL